jgi:hypothetical protein
MRPSLPRLLRLTLLVAVTTCGIAGVAHASRFVYTAVAAAACAAESPCAPPHVLVVDAETAAVVVRLPLPVHTRPAGMALSKDGAHLYVSNRAAEHSGATSMTVIDARQHRVVASYILPAAEAGLLAVRGDDAGVVIASEPMRLSLFDTATHGISSSVQLAAPIVAIAAGTALDRVFVLQRPGGGAVLTAFDSGTLARVGELDLGFVRSAVGMSLSNDEQRLHVLLSASISSPSGGGRRLVVDPAFLATLSSLGTFFDTGDPAELPASRDVLTADFSSRLYRYPPGANDGVTSIALPGQGLGITVPLTDARAFVTTGFNPRLNGGVEALVAIDLATNTIAQTIPLSGTASPLVTSTPAGAAACAYRLDSPYSSFPVTGGSATIRLTTTCDWHAASSQPWARLSTSSGSGSQTLTITVDPHVLPTPRAATITIGGQLVTVTQAGGVSDVPFGVVDTPADGLIGVTGALGMTGWALDDVGVAGVRIFRDPVAGEGADLIYVGTAALLEGARPDVAAYLPSLPYATRAGWGLQVLTNTLPNGGSGAFRFWAFADDVEGHSSLLGTRTFTAANTTATRPFGTIDTPGAGETVSGTIVNFGWVLTPAPGIVPFDGSTIDVIVDGVSIGHPVYNVFRSDIAALFPQYANATGAVGYFVLDTTTLSNGLHTISWLVRDDHGRAEGIGSRYFRVFNP